MNEPDHALFARTYLAVDYRPRLEGTLVALEPLEDRHVDDLLTAAAIDRSTFNFTYVPLGRVAMKDYVTAAAAEREAGRAVPFAIRSRASGEVLGTTSFLDLNVFISEGGRPPATRLPSASPQDLPSAVEIGSTWLSLPAQRSGVNTESKLLMLEHAFVAWHCVRVSFKTDARNDKSRAALTRLGACFEGVRRAHVPASDGTIRDSAYYSILAGEWLAVRAHLESLLARS